MRPIPTERDKKYIPKAIRMLSFVACLHYAMLDLEDELEDAGMLKHTVKHRFNMALSTVERVHSTVYTKLNTMDQKAGYEYNDKMDAYYKQVSECVLLTPPERAYNIVVAILRIIKSICKEITPQYYFAVIRDLDNVASMLDCCGIKDYELDNIITLNVK